MEIEIKSGSRKEEKNIDSLLLLFILSTQTSLYLYSKDDDEVDLRERKMKVRRRNEWMIEEYTRRERERDWKESVTETDLNPEDS